ncbi:MFS transporter [Gracilibacillus oryzae]|uniref:MFS transporter n=2 Tax=Gracilibacillus oryzae TaxID=1672701 RepID=A0A7C8L321_9BACI|nr:MFS transporter [Gracilibacillus oryzae]
MQARRSLFTTFIQGLTEMLAFFPVLLLLAILTVNENVYFWLTGLFVLLCLLVMIRSKMKKRPIVLIIAGIMAIGFSLLIGQDILAYLSSAVIGFIAAYRGVQYAETHREQLLPSRLLWTFGVPGYFFGYMLFSYFDSLVPYRGLLSGIGILFIIIMLFVTNRDLLQKESLSKDQKHRTSREMKKMNYSYLILTFLLVLILTNFQVIQSFLYHTVRSIMQAFISFVELFSNDEPPMEEQPVQNSQQMLPGMETGEPSKFAQVMEQIGIVVGIILIIVAVLFMLSLLFKKVRRMVKKAFLFIWDALKQVFTSNRFEQSDSEYTDEKENLFDWKNWRKEKQEEIKDRLQGVFGRKTNYDKLASEEKVRFLYREISRELRQQDKWQQSMTAHEVLAISEKEWDNLQRMYDQVRYGQDSLGVSSESELQSIWNKLRNK